MHPALAVGWSYPARVVALMADGRARLALGAATLDARCATGLREGEQLVVEVLQLRPEVVLRARRRVADEEGNA